MSRVYITLPEAFGRYLKGKKEGLKKDGMKQVESGVSFIDLNLA